MKKKPKVDKPEFKTEVVRTERGMLKFTREQLLTMIRAQYQIPEDNHVHVYLTDNNSMKSADVLKLVWDFDTKHDSDHYACRHEDD